MMERVYHEGIREPLRWIALAVFQPARFQAACEPTGFRQRTAMQARLIVPLFLLSFLLVTLVQVVPLPAHLLVWSDEPHELPLSPWLVSAIGVTFGLVVGLVFGTIWGVAFGIVVSFTAGVVFGLPGVYALLHTDVLGAWLVPVLASPAQMWLLTWSSAWASVSRSTCGAASSHVSKSAWSSASSSASSAGSLQDLQAALQVAWRRGWGAC